MTKDQSVYALELMLRSRYFENKTEELFKNGLIHGTTHLATGQEASQAGLCMALDNADWIVPTHRCHGFTICKGSDPYAMFSEMFGSAHGLAKGLGGSMHMPDSLHSNLGSSAVVGSGVPLATGIAFYMKRMGRNNISAAIFGDGASSRGSIHECMNMASIWKLPVLFYCENNGYGMSARSDRMISVKSIASRAVAYNMIGKTVDGNDIEAVFSASKEAVQYIKSGKGPYLLEVMTYRQKGHSKSDRRLYRTAEEEQAWLERCPILLFEKKLVASGVLSSQEVKKIETKVLNEINQAAATALNDSSFTLTPEQALALVYSPSKEVLA